MNICNVSIAEGIPPLASTMFPLTGFLILSLFFVIFFGLFINAFYDILLCKAKIQTVEKKGYKKLKLFTILFFILMCSTAYLMYELIF